jgi:hypothetical protein
LRTFAWMVLGWNLLTILGGAVVRATGSGAGCGRSWPTCQGTIVPRLEGATAVEFTHRAVSGLALLSVIALAVAVFRAFPKGALVRRGALLAVVAIIGEALIGALIVFSEWVADDASVARAMAVPLHLVNTLFLLASLTLTIVWLGPQPPRSRIADHRRWFATGAVGMVLIAATGAVTALADTLFPKEGVSFLLPEAGEHFLTRRRSGDMGGPAGLAFGGRPCDQSRGGSATGIGGRQHPGGHAGVVVAAPSAGGRRLVDRLDLAGRRTFDDPRGRVPVGPRPCQIAGGTCQVRAVWRRSPMVIPSTSASHEASMMFSWTPIVSHEVSWSAVSSSTRTRAAVPSAESSTRTR